MSTLDILLPLFAQVILTFVLMFAMAISRRNVLTRKEVRVADIALGQKNWPIRTTQIANAYQNQFELPVLFYVVIGLAIATAQVTLPLVVLAWIFVAFRVMHAYVHTGSNYVPRRFMTFAASVLALIAMWAVYAYQILSSAV